MIHFLLDDRQEFAAHAASESRDSRELAAVLIPLSGVLISCTRESSTADFDSSLKNLGTSAKVHQKLNNVSQSTIPGLRKLTGFRFSIQLSS